MPDASLSYSFITLSLLQVCRLCLNSSPSGKSGSISAAPQRQAQEVEGTMVSREVGIALDLLSSGERLLEAQERALGPDHYDVALTLQVTPFLAPPILS